MGSLSRQKLLTVEKSLSYLILIITLVIINGICNAKLHSSIHYFRNMTQEMI